MIRYVSDADIGDIVSIYNYYVINSVATFEEVEIDASEISDRIKAIRDAGLPWLVASEDGVVIGYAYAGPWNRRSAYRHTAEVTIYLSDQAVGKGVGSELYAALFSELKRKGIHLAVAAITLPNAASVAIHEKFGMRKVGQLSEVGKKFGRWLDVGFWELRLDE